MNNVRQLLLGGKGRRRLEGFRTAIRAALFALGPVFASFSANGQSFPEKTITVVMPIAPSTAFYITLRQMADEIQAKTGHSIVFDTAIGGNGVLGPQRVKRVEADGYTIGLTWAAPMSLNPLFLDTQYDPLKDFAYISMLTRHGIYFAAGAQFPAQNLQDLIAMAKAKPNGVKVAIAATGSKVGVLELQEAAGAQFLIVPYKSSAQGEVAALTGEVDLVATTAGSVLGQVKAGKMKGIFIGSKNRSPVAPGTQSVTELFPNVEAISWYALYAPAGTPADRIEWHHREWVAALKNPKIVERMQNTFGYEIVGSGPQEVVDQIRRELPANTRIVKQYNLSE